MNERLITLNSGLVHGMQYRTELAIYSPDLRNYAEFPEEPLATVVVTSVSAASVQAEIQQNRSRFFRIGIWANRRDEVSM